MSAMARLYIELQLADALYEVNLIGNPGDTSLAARLISALDDRGIELSPR